MPPNGRKGPPYREKRSKKVPTWRKCSKRPPYSGKNSLFSRGGGGGGVAKCLTDLHKILLKNYPG